MYVRKSTKEVSQDVVKVCENTASWHVKTGASGWGKLNLKIGSQIGLADWIHRLGLQTADPKAGGNTRPLAEEIVTSAERVLRPRFGTSTQEWRCPAEVAVTGMSVQGATLSEDGSQKRVAEKSLTFPDEEVQEDNWLARELPTRARQYILRKTDVRSGLAGTRVRFGHPRRKKDRRNIDPMRWRNGSESQGRVYIGWGAWILHATDGATAEATARDAVLAGKQEHDKDTTSKKGGKMQATGSEGATPEMGEHVYERSDREVRHFTLPWNGGLASSHIMRRGGVDMQTDKQVDIIGDVAGVRVAEPLPDGVRDLFTRIYFRLPRAELEEAARVKVLEIGQWQAQWIGPWRLGVDPWQYPCIGKQVLEVGQ